MNDQGERWQLMHKSSDVPGYDDRSQFSIFPLQEAVLEALAEKLAPQMYEFVEEGSPSTRRLLPPPTDVQRTTLLHGLAGHSLLVQSKSGTGKTIAMALCSISRVDPQYRFSWAALRAFRVGSGAQRTDPKELVCDADWLKARVADRKRALMSGWAGVQALQGIIVVPTRELVGQVTEEVGYLVRYLTDDEQIRVLDLQGGSLVQASLSGLKTIRPHLVVSTPGRLLSAVNHNSKASRVKDVWWPPPRELLKLLCFDEADRLFTENFTQQSKDVIARFGCNSTQILAMSATFDPPVLSRLEAAVVDVDLADAELVPCVAHRKAYWNVGLFDVPAVDLSREVAELRTIHRVFLCSSYFNRAEDTAQIPSQRETPQMRNLREAEETGTALLGRMPSLDVPTLQSISYHLVKIPASQTGDPDWTMVKDAKLSSALSVLDSISYRQAVIFTNYNNWGGELSDRLRVAGVPSVAITSQMSQSLRQAALSRVRRGEFRVVVCSDLLARGLDLVEVDLVLHADVAQDKETFLHRSGRTGRFGNRGTVMLFATADEEEKVRLVALQAGVRLEL
ncbi:MAG: uncharacterized protein KVP18_000112 [Porospora cf. gigantea A]|uniref:uncharacterized protein n=2 Tax=Porospora cf. gigantea A TaxID=2853593 RepID=UPI00355A86A2|nr:MAG: hypothetical protein KVP18_000112 [Porospora cf. gigantea A]